MSARAVYVDVAVQQFVKGATVVAALPNPLPIAMQRTDAVERDDAAGAGRFRPGYGEALVLAAGPGSGGVGASGPVYLKPGAVK